MLISSTVISRFKLNINLSDTCMAHCVTVCEVPTVSLRVSVLL